MKRKEKSKPKAYVIDFIGDLKASAVPALREEVSAVLDVAKRMIKLLFDWTIMEVLYTSMD